MARRLLAVAFLLSFAGLTFASTASDLCSPSANPCTVSTAQTVDPGSTLDFGSRQLDIAPTGSITIPSGQLTILAGSVRLETHGRILGGDSQGTGVRIKDTNMAASSIAPVAKGDG